MRLSLLNMAAIGEPQILRDKLELSIATLKNADLALARHGCVALQRIAAAGPIDAKAAKAVIKSLEKILVSAPKTEAEGDEWYATAEQAVGTIYAPSESPEPLLTSVHLQKMGAALTPEGQASEGGEEMMDANALSRVLFLIGHVALKTLVYFEQCKKILDKRRAKLLDDLTADDDIAAAAGGGAAAAEENMDRCDDYSVQLIEAHTLLGAWAPLVAAVCRNESGHFGAELRSAACSDDVQAHVRLVRVLRQQPSAALHRHEGRAGGLHPRQHRDCSGRPLLPPPEHLEPWTSHLYAQLKDNEPRVRKNVLMVLMHLILNDMVKVKGQVAELALCLLDGDERISALAKLFFTEFAKKGTSPVYNLLPDIVSSLSSALGLSSDGFREILEFLITFIQKDKQTESMVEKLCLRFDTSDKVQHHREISFCVVAHAHREVDQEAHRALPYVWQQARRRRRLRQL